jgi:hypothetical protein
MLSTHEYLKRDFKSIQSVTFPYSDEANSADDASNQSLVSGSVVPIKLAARQILQRRKSSGRGPAMTFVLDLAHFKDFKQ